jgi:hypothetical protein
VLTCLAFGCWEEEGAYMAFILAYAGASAFL